MNEYSIREIFELRQTMGLSPRHSVVRIFQFKSHFGLLDGSGAIWPVNVETEFGVAAELGSVFRVRLLQSEPLERTADSSDGCGQMAFRILEKLSGSVSGDWLLTGIPDPRFPELSVDVYGSTIETSFYRTATSDRLRMLASRSRIFQCTRQFFTEKGYMELDTPTLVISGGVERYLNSFITVYRDHRGSDWQMELPTSPEISLKKIVAEGAERVFSLAHAFRNSGELSCFHDPEFMMLEWYRRSDDFLSLQRETQSLVEFLSSVLPSSRLLPQCNWPTYSVVELFKEILDLDLNSFDDTDAFRNVASQKSISITITDTWDDVFCKLFMEYVEPFLKVKEACFVTSYPRRMGALAAVNQNNPRYVDRFELYLFGVEICNGYRELVDYGEYLERVEALRLLRPEMARDPLFESASRVGIYPCVGNALGIDRLISVLLNSNEIQAILPWPFRSRFGVNTIALE
jgi:lysyl-tRNA synthetase class 2